jgi:hypothetical protein
MAYVSIMNAALGLARGAKAGASTFAKTKTGKRLIKNRGKIGALAGASAGLQIGSATEKNKNKKYLV